MGIQEMIQEDIQIPSLPEIFYQFKEAIDDPDSSFQKIGDIIATDPGLTARLLKIVNSAYYGFPSQIDTVSHAVGIIGRQRLNDLVLTTVVIDRFKGIPIQSINMKSFWRHSIACGLAARILANHMQEANPERFFVAGMLHDIGHVAICIKYSVKVLEIVLRTELENETLHQAEFKILGFNHANVGRYLLKSWKLPKVLEEAVGFHHNPTLATQYTLEASVVHVADVLANTLKLGFSAEETTLPALDENALKCIQVTEDTLFSTIKEQVEKQIDQTAQIFLATA